MKAILEPNPIKTIPTMLFDHFLNCALFVDFFKRDSINIIEENHTKLIVE